MKGRLLVIAVLLAAACAHPAVAQSMDPSSVTFDHDDVATAQRYEGGYFALPVKADRTCDLESAPAATPTAVDRWAKPANATTTGIAVPLLAKPIGCYVLRVLAVDVSGLASDWSLPSAPFARRPATPSKPVAK